MTIVLQVYVLSPSSDSKIPQIYMQVLKEGSSALRVKITVTYVDREDPNKCASLGEASKSLKTLCMHVVKD